MGDKFMNTFEEIKGGPAAECHGGNGVLYCRNMLKGIPSESFKFFHHDILKKGVSIGEHPHTTEEIWYLTEGAGTLYSDGAAYPLKAGDFSICLKGHSHAFTATSDEDCVLIVVGVKEKAE